MVIQITQLNELMQRKLAADLKEKDLKLEDIRIEVEGPKIFYTILATNEVITY